MKRFAIYTFAIIAILLLLITCQKEDLTIDEPQTEVENTSKLKTRKVSLSQVPLIQDFLTKEQNGNFFKSSKNSNINLDISNIIEVIDSLDRTNYSFKFTVPNTPAGTFYNLIVSRTPQGELLTPYVLKFKCDSEYLEEYIANNFDFKYFKGKIGIHKYTDFFKPDEFFKTETLCPPEFDEVGDPIACEETTTQGSSNSGGGGDNSEGSNSAGTGNHSGSNNNSSSNGGSSTNSGGSSSSNCDWWTERRPTYPCPHADYETGCLVEYLIIDCSSSNQKSSKNTKTDVDCPECPQPTGTIGVNNDTQQEDPCKELKNLFNYKEANIKTKLQNLKTTVDESGENGFLMKKQANTYTNTTLPATTTTDIPISTGAYTYAAAHTHPAFGAYPMYSWGDIYTLLSLRQHALSTNTSEVTFILASKNRYLESQVNVYALKINDFVAFRKAFYKALADIVKEDPDLDGESLTVKLEALNGLLKDKYDKANENQQEKAFLEAFKDFNISLYKANSNLDNWSKITVPEFTVNASGVSETPCN